MKPDSLVVGLFETRCYWYPLGPDTKDCCIIDPGDDGTVIINQIAESGLIPKIVLLTHGHFDHVAALPALREHYGPLLEIAIHVADISYLGPDSLEVHRETFRHAPEVVSLVEKAWQPLPKATRILDEGQKIGTLRVLHLPGHTPGSVAFYDESSGILFTGDTLFRDGIGSTAFPGSNIDALRASLKRLSGMDGTIRIFPGHGASELLAKAPSRVLH
ncbi:MBL fold hydrolase [Spirochaetia bacterium]|nr:MBL fold hydrolase [Spirochaetia bacterium]